MSSNLSSIITLCAQRKKQQLLNIPPSRIETISPYIDSNNTKFKLDMRRKAEVLKYDQGNTKTNNLTKKQLFTQVINGRSAPVSNSYIKTNSVISTKASQVLSCNNNDLPITTPSSASGVPRDYINNINTLYCDPTIPLYNYINPVLTRSYGIINSPFPTDVIQYSNYTNVNAVSSSLTMVEFTDATTNNYYILSLLNIPLAVQISGYINGTNNSVIGPITIPDISLNIYYNSSLLSPNSNYIYTIDPSNSYTINITKLNGYMFSGTIYIGNLSISNIILYSSPGYLYDFKLEFNITGILKSYTNLSNVSISVISNVTKSYLLQPQNCNMTFSNKTPNISNFGVFTISAI